MTTTRNVTGHFEHSDGSPWVDAPIAYRLLSWSYLSGSVLPSDTITDTTDDSGNTATSLWTNAEGSIPTIYVVTLPDGSQQEFILPEGESSISLPELFDLYQTPHEWNIPGHEGDHESLRLGIYAAFANTASASQGDALVGYKNSALGAVAGTVHGRLNEVVSIFDFGAVGDGETDDLAAFALANTYAASVYDTETKERATIVIPARKYHVSNICQFTSPAIILAHGAVIDNTVWVGAAEIDIHGLYVHGARYNGFVLHRLQNATLYSCGATHCGGFGLTTGGTHRSQTALGKIAMFTSKHNAGGYNNTTGVGGLHCITIPGSEYSPGAITNAGSGYSPDGQFVSWATGGTGARAILAFTISGGVITECQPIHGGAGYTAGDVLSFSNAAARNDEEGAVTAGSGFAYTVGDVLDTRNWNNSMEFDRLILRECWRYGVQMDGRSSYNTWITPQIEGNRTRDIPLVQGTSLTLTIIGAHIVGVRVWSVGAPSIPVTSLTRVGTTATLVATAHGLQVNDFIQVTGASPFAGLFAVRTVPDANTLTYRVRVDAGSTSYPAALWIEKVPDTNGDTRLFDFQGTGLDGRTITLLGGRIGNQFSMSTAPRVDLLKLDEAGQIVNTEVFSHETTNFGATGLVFTPGLEFDTPGDASFVYSTQVGRYFEEPGRVFITIEIIVTISWTTASGNLRITGLPISAASIPSRHPLTVARVDNINTSSTAVSVTAAVVANNTFAYLYQNRDNASSSAIGTAELASGTQYLMEISGTYMIAVNSTSDNEEPEEDDPDE